MDKEELVTFWKSWSALDPDPGIFWMILQHCEIKRPQLSSYLRKKTDRIFTKILSQMDHWTRKFPLNFGSHPDPGLRTQTPDRDRISLCKSLRCFNRRIYSRLDVRLSKQIQESRVALHTKFAHRVCSIMAWTHRATITTMFRRRIQRRFYPVYSVKEFSPKMLQLYII